MEFLVISLFNYYMHHTKINSYELLQSHPVIVFDRLVLTLALYV